MVFLDYTTATIGSSEGVAVLKFTASYKCMVTVQINLMETNGKIYSLYKRVAADPARLDFFIDNNNSTGIDTRSYGLTKIMNSGEQIFGNGDLSPFDATLHIFRLPEAPW